MFTENKIKLNNLVARTSKQGRVTIDVGFAIDGKEQLAALIAKLRGIESVLDVERTTG